MRLWWLLCATAFTCFAQQAAELTPAWNISESLLELVSQSQRLSPVLDELRPEEWVSKGAPEGYVDQAKSARNQIAYLKQTAEQLSRRPQSMTGTLEVFLRLMALESMLDSLSQGVRRYQNPALADLLQGVISENSANRGRLREYLVELVATKETELRIADAEAQRCRGMLIRQPATRKQQPKKQTP